MKLEMLHVAAAVLALVLGAVIFMRRKGGTWHVVLGRLYVGTMLAVNVPALLVYEATGKPGPFHVLAVVSLLTTAIGWWSLRSPRRSSSGVNAHATFMTWSWIGVTTAGLAQFANHRWPADAPWPVLIVVGCATVAGLALVPRVVSRQITRLRARRPLDRPPRSRADDLADVLPPGRCRG